MLLVRRLPDAFDHQHDGTCVGLPSAVADASSIRPEFATARERSLRTRACHVPAGSNGTDLGRLRRPPRSSRRFIDLGSVAGPAASGDALTQRRLARAPGSLLRAWRCRRR